METITDRFVLPITPTQIKINPIYPWGNNTFNSFYNELYANAIKNGYTGSLNDFRNDILKFLISANDTNITLYNGEYNIIPMADVDQILKTKNTYLQQDIIVEKIPLTKVSNLANGYTAIIG